MVVYNKNGKKITCDTDQWPILKELGYTEEFPPVKDTVEEIIAPKKVVFKKKIITEE